MDVKIGLQIALIEVNLLGFFLRIPSAFMGRIRSNQATICDESRLDWIAIKLRMMKNLRFVMKNLRFCSKFCLISSRLNQELSFDKEEKHFIREITGNFVDHPIR